MGGAVWGLGGGNGRGSGERGCDGRYHACGKEGEALADNGASVRLREGEGPAVAGGRCCAAPSRPGLRGASAPAPPPRPGGE